MVLIPTALIAAYLWIFAADQYSSTVAFSVRTEDTHSALDVTGILGQVAQGSTGSDSDILHDFIHSQQAVELINQRVDLKAIYSRHHETDPWFGFDPSGTIEDLTRYWQSMVHVQEGSSAGSLEIVSYAFTSEDAQRINEAILAESTLMINRLSAIAREDKIRYAREERELALARLREARASLTSFRTRTQLIDPISNVQGQITLVSTLQAQQAAAMIELEMLRETATGSDPRVAQAERRLDVIQRQIAQERQRFGGGTDDVGGFAALVSEYELLSVDREFAEQAYRSAFAAYDAALSESAQTSRYLAPYIPPTLAEGSYRPQRLNILIVATIFLMLGWALAVLIYYSVRDRR